jgi:hypothetical protein
MLQVFYLDVAYVLQWLHMFSWYFRHMLQVFQLFWMCIGSVLSRCCKSRSDVANVIVRPICYNHLIYMLGPPACVWVWRGASGRREKRCSRRSRHGPRVGERRRRKWSGASPHMKQMQARGRAQKHDLRGGASRHSRRGHPDASLCSDGPDVKALA